MIKTIAVLVACIAVGRVIRHIRSCRNATAVPKVLPPDEVL